MSFRHDNDPVNEVWAIAALLGMCAVCATVGVVGMLAQAVAMAVK